MRRDASKRCAEPATRPIIPTALATAPVKHRGGDLAYIPCDFQGKPALVDHFRGNRIVGIVQLLRIHNWPPRACCMRLAAQWQGMNVVVVSGLGYGLKHLVFFPVRSCEKPVSLARALLYNCFPRRGCLSMFGSRNSELICLHRKLCFWCQPQA